MTNRNSLTIKTYDQIADDYERLHHGLSGEIELDKFIKYLKPGARTLDAGCGFGTQLKYLKSKGFDAYGFDASKELLKLAKKNAPSSKIRFADLREKLPYKNDFFDGVLAKTTLHHLEPEDLAFAISEIRRVLKPGGIFFVSWKEGHGEMMTKEEVAAGRERYYNLKSMEEVQELIKTGGFKIIENYTYNWTKRYHKKRQFANFIVIFATKP